MISVVLDTNVFVGALQRKDGVNREILRRCFRGELEPLIGDALYLEHQDLLGRDYVFKDSSFSPHERQDFFDDFCSICRWVDVHYRWRPNLPDEADNHVLELAIAGAASYMITWNKKDFSRGDLVLPNVSIVTPVEFLIERRAMESH